jgi:signal transduction histidine kinase
MGREARDYPVSEDEEERLRTLREYDILDTPKEEAYEDLLTLASAITGAEVAFVGFVDEDREWFKAETGVGKDSIPRSEAFCAYNIADPTEPLVIEDAREDPRVQDSNLVTGSANLRFYAGFPILAPNDQPMGAFCVMDREPQTISEDKLQALKVLADQSMMLMEHRRLGRWLARRKDELERFAEAAGEHIKDPLSSVTVHHRFLEEDLADADEEIQENLAAAMDGTRQIERIAVQLMEYAHLSPEAAEDAEPLHLEPILDEVWADLEPAASRTQATLKVEDLPPVRADRRQVRHLLLNILDNAVRYQDDPPAIIEIGADRSGSMVRFTVADNGRGIEVEDVDRVFQIFYRGSRAKEVPGSGLGLALAEKVVELHGGTIEIVSTVDEGTTATFTLPAADADDGA